MKARQIWFTQPRQISICEAHLPPLGLGQVLVKTLCSAISAGTEMLVYRGQLPGGMAVDATLTALQQQSTYPLPYGYACVGRVESLGSDVSSAWQDKRVFAFQPHASHFVASPTELLVLPEDITSEAAVFLANMETAVNLVLDGGPAIGERVVVLGQGVVGLLLSSLLAQFPLAELLAVDGIAARRDKALNLGVTQVYDPVSTEQLAALKHSLHLPVDVSSTPGVGADLVYEVSGVPDALNLAIELCSFSGRIVVGSWYGDKSTNINLGGVAHRNRLKLISSQVSTIAPELLGRWDKTRRFQTAWEMIRRMRPEALITHRVAIEQAGEIYTALDQTPETVLQAIFIY